MLTRFCVTCECMSCSVLSVTAVLSDRGRSPANHLNRSRGHGSQRSALTPRRDGDTSERDPCGVSPSPNTAVLHTDESVRRAYSPAS
jgi:hypothetical protein